MLLLRRRSLAILAAGGLCSRAAAAADTPAAVHGGGSSFVSPVMARWTEGAKSKGMSVEYAVLGAGSSQNQILAGDIDYAAGELAMSSEKLRLAELVQFPVVFGAITFSVNIEGIADGQLRLNAALLGGIFSGALKKWNDPAIAAANPGPALPDLDIRPVFLGDTTGAVFSTSTTLVRYLMANNADWQAKFTTKIGSRWAVGSMVPTSAAMVPLLKSRPGGIGYMALGTALSNKLPRVVLQNKSGEMLLPSPASLQTTVSKIDWKASPDLVVNVTDLPGAGVWPLVLCSYAVMSRAAAKKDRAEKVRAFFTYALNDGGDAAIASSALPLPAEAKAKVLELLSKG